MAPLSLPFPKFDFQAPGKKVNLVYMSAILVLVGTSVFYLVRRGRAEIPSKAHVSAIAHPYYKTGEYALFSLADSLQYQLNYPEAAKQYQKKLEEPLKDKQRIYVLNQLVWCLLAMNRDSAARSILEALQTELPEIGKMPDHDQVDFLFNAGVHAAHIFRLEQASKLLQQALEGYRALYPEGHWKIGQCLTKLGLLKLHYSGDSDSAFLMIQQAYELYQASAPLNKLSAEAQYALACGHILLRSHEAGQAYCEAAISLLHQAPFTDSLLLARCLSLKGNMLKKRGQNENGEFKRRKFFSEADAFFRQAVELGKQMNSPEQQLFCRDWAINACWESDSLKFFFILRMLDSLTARQPDRYAHTDRLRGYFYFHFGQLKKAIQWYRRFERQLELTPVKEELLISETYYVLKEAFLQSGSYEEALKYHARLCAPAAGKNITLEQILEPSFYRTMLYPSVGLKGAAEILLAQHGKTGSEEALRKALECYVLADNLLFPSIRSADEDAVLTFQKEVGEQLYPQALEAVYRLFQKTGEHAHLNYAFRFCERMKSFLLFRGAHRLEQGEPKPPDALLDSLRWLDAEINRLKWRREHQPLHRKNDGALQLGQALGLFERLQQSLKKRYPSFFHQKQEQALPSIFSLQRELEPERAFIEYYLSDKHLFTFYADADTVIFLQTAAVDTLQRKLEELRLMLEHPVNDLKMKEQFREVSGWLYSKLLLPVEKPLSRRKKILLIPDKFLHLLPFEALLTPCCDAGWSDFRKAPYLLHRWEVSYSPSWKIYQYNKDKKLPSRLSALACTYGRGKGEGALPNAEEEINAMRLAFGKNKVSILKGSGCKKQQFLRQCGHYDLLHLSLHAESSLDDRRNNQVYFQLPRQDSLHGFEMLNHPLRAGLVVLSACETAYGKTEAGEGAYSLSRYFLQAGASRVMASLWKVDEAATARLMENFYGCFSENPEPFAGLHKAKLLFLKQAETDFLGHPGFWAGMVGMQ